MGFSVTPEVEQAQAPARGGADAARGGHLPVAAPDSARTDKVEVLKKRAGQGPPGHRTLTTSTEAAGAESKDKSADGDAHSQTASLSTSASMLSMQDSAGSSTPPEQSLS